MSGVARVSECYLGVMSGPASSVLVVFAALSGLASAQQPLLSPWDSNSVKPGDIRYGCPAPVPRGGTGHAGNRC